MYEIEYERGIANRGNQARLKKVMDRAIRGEKLTIGFLGGSITQGSLSSKPTLCYAYRVFDWWKQTFPQAEFTYVNAGIGGTTSHFGVARVQSDLLAYEPDFVKLAESYGAHGIRVTKAEEIAPALAQAKANTDALTVIEFLIATDELVLPMVKSGNPMSEMILR